MPATLDHRGRPARPFRPTFALLLRFNLAGRRPAPMPHAVCKGALRKCSAHPAVGGLVGAVAVGFPMVIAFAMMWMPAGVLDLKLWLIPIFLIPAVLIPFGMVAVLVRAPKLAWSTWTEQIIAQGHCPSCGYPLEGLDPEPDGCRVCPECGGAWAAPSETIDPPRALV